MPVAGRPDPLPSWRLVAITSQAGARAHRRPVRRARRRARAAAQHYARAVRDRRAHLVTVFGEPGIGKSRLIREFVRRHRARDNPARPQPALWRRRHVLGARRDGQAVRRHQRRRSRRRGVRQAARVLRERRDRRSPRHRSGTARCERARAQARRAPLGRARVGGGVRAHAAARARLRGHPLGRGAAPARDRAHRAFGSRRAAADHLRDAPGVARAEAVVGRRQPPRNRDRARAADSRRRASSSPRVCEPDGSLAPEQRALVLEKAEGNPLFLEETLRMLAESGGDGNVIPDTIHALIAARIDALPPDQKQLLQRASVIGRVFWHGALEQLAPELDATEVIDALIDRELVLAEERSTIAGERAFRFKHILIAEVAYEGVSKTRRAELHELFARWLHDRTGDELMEIRAYHLDRAVCLREELEGAAPEDLRLRRRDGARGSGQARAEPRGLPDGALAARAGARARADAASPLPRGARGVASAGHADRRRRDGAGRRGGGGGGRVAHPGPRAHGTRRDGSLPRRRRRRGAHADREGGRGAQGRRRRRRTVRRLRDRGADRVMAQRLRRGRADRPRGSRVRPRHRAARISRRSSSRPSRRTRSSRSTSSRRRCSHARRPSSRRRAAACARAQPHWEQVRGSPRSRAATPRPSAATAS